MATAATAAMAITVDTVVGIKTSRLTAMDSFAAMTKASGATAAIVVDGMETMAAGRFRGDE